MTKNKEINYGKIKWIIDTTGSNTIGTHYDTVQKKFMEEKGFVKPLKGNPMFITEKNYTEKEIIDIIKTLFEKRAENGQKKNQIEGMYCRVKKSVHKKYAD